jgi:ABC-type branched-subunit amino acid transport system substrate-binding protein
MAANPDAPGALAAPGAGFDPRALAAGPVLMAAPMAGGASVGPLDRSHTVAALLPLTGTRNSVYAVEILAGLRLAAQRSRGMLNVVEYDTMGIPANAVTMVNTIAADPSVVAIVGPLNSDEALAAAQTAQAAAVPLIALSTRIGLTAGRGYVFRVFLTYEAQARAAARYAVMDLGIKSLGALYPNDLYGGNMLRYFEEEATALGAAVTARESYQSPGGDYAEAARLIAGGSGKVRPASTSQQAKTGFQALYMPESPSVASQLLPFLALNDMTRMRYLGTSLWQSPDFVKSAGRYLEGGVIPAPFSPLSQRPEAQAFLEAWRQSSGKDPDQFAVYGYDAGIALLAALSSGASTRQALPGALRALPPIPGASGPFVFDSEGEYKVSPLFLTVKDSEFKLLKDAAPY